MNKTPRKINLDDWEKFGGGYTADSFYHKTDKSLMMKLYAPFMEPEEGLHELEVSETLTQFNIPIPKPIEYVTTGTQYGAVFERLTGKRSIARIIADEPDRLDEMAHIFAIEGKKLHETKIPHHLFKAQEDIILEQISKCDFFNSAIIQKAEKIVKETPQCDMALHGDFHVGNMLIVSDKPVFIDLGDFSYGHPYYDLGEFYFNTIADPDTCFRLFHFPIDVMRNVWDRFEFYYFGPNSNAKETLLPYAWLAAVRYCMKLGSKTENLNKVVEKYFDLV